MVPIEQIRMFNNSNLRATEGFPQCAIAWGFAFGAAKFAICMVWWVLVNAALGGYWRFGWLDLGAAKRTNADFYRASRGVRWGKSPVSGGVRCYGVESTGAQHRCAAYHTPSSTLFDSGSRARHPGERIKSVCGGPEARREPARPGPPCLVKRAVFAYIFC